MQLAAFDGYKLCLVTACQRYSAFAILSNSQISYSQISGTNLKASYICYLKVRRTSERLELRLAACKFRCSAIIIYNLAFHYYLVANFQLVGSREVCAAQIFTFENLDLIGSCSVIGNPISLYILACIIDITYNTAYNHVFSGLCFANCRFDQRFSYTCSQLNIINRLNRYSISFYYGFSTTKTIRNSNRLLTRSRFVIAGEFCPSSNILRFSLTISSSYNRLRQFQTLVNLKLNSTQSNRYKRLSRNLNSYTMSSTGYTAYSCSYLNSTRSSHLVVCQVIAPSDTFGYNFREAVGICSGYHQTCGLKSLICKIGRFSRSTRNNDCSYCTFGRVANNFTCTACKLFSRAPNGQIAINYNFITLGNSVTIVITLKNFQLVAFSRTINGNIVCVITINIRLTYISPNICVCRTIGSNLIPNLIYALRNNDCICSRCCCTHITTFYCYCFKSFSF